MFIVVVGGHIIIPSIELIFQVDRLKIRHGGARFWAKILLFFGGLEVKVEGIENIPGAGPIIFVSNHQSYVDIPILISILPMRFRFVAWDMLFEVPIFGPYLRRMGLIPISDNNASESYKAILQTIEFVRSGESMVIFPEGRLTRDGKLGRFGRGAAMVALNTGIPVVPIAIDGTYNILPRGEWIFHPHRVRIKIGRPIMFGPYNILDRKIYLMATEKMRRAIEELLQQR